MLVIQGLPVANDHVCLIGKDGGDQLGDLAAGVLVVGISVDDNVSTQRQRELHAANESSRETTVAAVPQDVIRAIFQRHFGSGIGGAVVDHQHDYFVDPGDLPWNLGEYDRQMPGFVIGRDLDDEFHD